MAVIEESARRCLGAIDGLRPMPDEWPGMRTLSDILLWYVVYVTMACCAAHWLGMTDGGFDLAVRVASASIPIAILFLSSVAMSWFIDHATEGGCARYTPIEDRGMCVCAHAEPCGSRGVDLQLHVTTYICRGLWCRMRVVHSHLPLDGYLDAERPEPAVLLEIERMLEIEGITHCKKNV